jgi:predicted enzyme related to lactoylglutathione lyase
MADPLDALRLTDEPVQPDATFAAQLRERIARALLTSSSLEEPMSPNTLSRSEFRNGVKHGDVSYVTLGVPDLTRAKAFYGAVLGWSYSVGSNALLGAQVEEIAPMTGLWAGPQPVGPRVQGAVLAFRVDDIHAAVTAVRNAGGTMSEPHQEPYALAAEGVDNQGTPFYLHEMPATPGVSAPMNGSAEGDLSYITLLVPDLDEARAFYGAVLGWTFNVGRVGGAQVNGTVPQIGVGTLAASDRDAPTAILGYRVDDIEATLTRVVAAGGTASPIAERPYGLESYATDDQGTPFYLHQLAIEH